MSTKFNYSYHKIAAALIMLSPVAAVNAAAPVFVENSVLENEFKYLFNASTSNSEHLSLAINEQNTIFTAYQDGVGTKDAVLVSKYQQDQLSLSEYLSADADVAAAYTFPQVRVNPVDQSLVLGFMENGNIITRTSVDGTSWQGGSTVPITGTAKIFKMKLDSQGNIYLFYANTQNKSELLKFDGTSWDVVFGPVSTKSTTVTTLSAGLAIDSQDKPILVYRDVANTHKITVATPDSDGVWQKIVTTGASNPAYMEVAIDSQDNLHMVHVGFNAQAGISVYTLDGSDPTDSTWAAVGNKNFAYALAENYNGKLVGAKSFYLKFDSKDNPYVVFQQVNDTPSTKKTMQAAHLVDDVWTEIPYVLASVLKDPTKTTSLNHDYVDIAIDSYDRPIVTLRSNGTGQSSGAYVLRMNLLPDSANNINFNANEGFLSAGKLTAIDDDFDAITLSLSGTDASLFNLNETTGELSFKEAPIIITNSDYTVIVTASAGGETTSATVQVTLINDVSNDTDTDDDGVIDILDDFLEDAAASIDTDGDGAPDSWNEGKSASDSTTGLVIDIFPNDASEWLDNDKDGVGDNADYYDDDPTRWENEDIDGDGLENDVDLDDDGDGILDVNDAFPKDVSASIDIDGDGSPDSWNDGKSAADSTTGLTTLDVFPNDSTEWLDSDGDGVGDNADYLFPNDPTDQTPPKFAEDISIVLDASGILTDISAGVAAKGITAFDLFDGDVTAVIEGETRDYVSGNHVISMSATDKVGLTSITDVNLVINPLVQLGSNLTAVTGGQLTIPVALSGPAATYPIVIDYTLTTLAEVTTGQLTLEQDALSAELVISVSAEAQQGDELVIQFTQATNAVVSELTKVSAIVDNQNYAPTLQVSISQAGQPVSVIVPTLGPVTLTATVTDLNSSDEHNISFEVIGGEFIDDGIDEAQSTLVFDPTSLVTGSYPVKVTVTEANTDAQLTSELTVKVKVDAELTEIVVDIDQDGIADSVYFDDDATRLPITADEQPMQVLPGLTLSIGDLAAGGTSASIDAELIIDDAELVIDDVHYSAISTITNFNVSGLSVSGDSVAVVLPLAAGVTIPAEASYRKYSEAKGWFTFVEDENNSLASASKDSSGNCPAPLSIAYLNEETLLANGLLEGKDCIQLTIEDGGANDADEMANGRVADPGVLVSELPNASPVIIVTKGAGISGQEVYIQASATDVEGDVVTFSWKQLTGETVTISEPNSDTLRFTAPIVSERTELTFELTAYDGRNSDSQVVQLSVVAEETEIELDEHRHSGSFGWLLSLVALIGLGRRKLSK